MAQSVEPITFESLKKRDAPDVYEMTIQPDQARRIVHATQLAGVNFRKLEDTIRMQSMVEAMRRGEWVWTDADPIRLEIHPQSGEIVATDGQHRLYACAQSRRVLRTLVLFGPAWTSGLHVDRNKTRSVTQFLQHEYGLKNSTAVVSVVRHHLARIYAYHRETSVGYQRTALRDEEVIQFTVENITELNWALNRYHPASSRGFNSVAYATFLFEVHSIDHEMATQFHHDMSDNNLDPVDPLAQLRRTVSSRFAATGRRANNIYTIDNLVKAWNLRAGGQTQTMWRHAADDVMFPLGYVIPPLPENVLAKGQRRDRAPQEDDSHSGAA